MTNPDPWFSPIGNPKAKVYVSGPMTGIPNHNGTLFNLVASRFRDLGYRVCNPVENDRMLVADIEGTLLEWPELIRFDLARVLDADMLVLLPGWEGSRGARLEALVGLSIDIVVIEWETLEQLPHERVNLEAYEGRGDW